jgi:hypothetical protein
MTTQNEQNQTTSPEAIQTMADTALRRSRRWQLTLAGCAGFFWILLAVGIIGIALFTVTYLTPIWAYVGDQALEGNEISEPDMERLAMTLVLFVRILYYASISMALSLLLAGGTTLLYIHVSHRISLKRLQAELANISDQLRSLHQSMQR